MIALPWQTASFTAPPLARRRRGTLRKLARLVPLFVATIGAPAVVRGIEMRSAMLADPCFEPLQTVVTIPHGAIELWIDALRQHDDDSCREACAALVRAHRRGIDVEQLATEPLREILQHHPVDPISLRAAALAAVQLDLRELAPQLAAVLRESDRDLQRIIEPALADWRHAPMAVVWRSRLTDAAAHRQERMLAYRGLGKLQDAASADRLLTAVVDARRDFAERLAAAEAVAEMPSARCAAMAVELSAGQLNARRLAVALLANASDVGAAETLSQLASDPDQAVAAAALERLLVIAPQTCLAALQSRHHSTNARLRLLAVRALAANPGPPAVERLGAMLDDAHPYVRTAASDALAALAATDELRPEVQQQIVAALGPHHTGRAAEQAALVAGAIGDADAAPRLVELLHDPHDALGVAAAWALAELAIGDTATAITDEIRRETERTQKIVADLAPVYAAQAEPRVALPRLDGAFAKVEHLILALGRIRHHDASPMLAAYVPKPVPQVRGQPPALETYKQDRLRAAAIWSLGLLYADSAPAPPADLVAELLARMEDTTPIPPEADMVRQMAAVSLARMGRRELLSHFEQFFDPQAHHTKVGRACGWGIGHLTGSAPPRSRVVETPRMDWFLVPWGGK